jgi:hypothetical protein
MKLNAYSLSFLQFYWNFCCYHKFRGEHTQTGRQQAFQIQLHPESSVAVECAGVQEVLCTLGHMSINMQGGKGQEAKGTGEQHIQPYHYLATYILESWLQSRVLLVMLWTLEWFTLEWFTLELALPHMQFMQTLSTK